MPASNAAALLAEGYTWPELHRLVGATLRTGLSALVRGHPGVGKSTLAQALADEMELPLVDIRLAQRDPSDLCGVWFPDRDTQTLVAYPPAWARKAAEEPCFIFLDEINAAVTRLHQAAAYQIVLEKRVGELRFHPGTVVLAAGNLEEDNAIVTSLSSALCNRFTHFVLRVDPDSWLAWGEANRLDSTVLGYIAGHGAKVLYDQSRGELAFPSPRSWAMASQLCGAGEEADLKRLVAACVGSEHAEEFFAWRSLYGKIDPEKIIRKGKIPNFTRGKNRDPSFMYAATFAVAEWLRSGPDLSDEEIANVVAFLTAPGLEMEFSFLFLRHIRPEEELFVRLRGLPEFRTLASRLVGLRASMFT